MVGSLSLSSISLQGFSAPSHSLSTVKSSFSLSSLLLVAWKLLLLAPITTLLSSSIESLYNLTKLPIPSPPTQFSLLPFSPFHGGEPTTLKWSPLRSTSPPALFFHQISLPLILPRSKELRGSCTFFLMCLLLHSPASRDHNWVVPICRA